MKTKKMGKLEIHDFSITNTFTVKEPFDEKINKGIQLFRNETKFEVDKKNDQYLRNEKIQ